MSTTRTIGPLHFEDLEPHRFEDLVRQIAYGYRDWYELQATGRSGSDEGVDILGVERIVKVRNTDDSDEEEIPETTEERQWVIQCKREKRISPKKMGSVIE